jgi:RNA-directed DNA polymerase
MPEGSATGGSPRQTRQGSRKDMQTIDKVLSARNLTEACKDVIKNKGSWGLDKMSVKELKLYLDKNREELTGKIRHGRYLPQPIR